MKTLRKIPALLALLSGLPAGQSVAQTPLFTDAFTTDTSSAWTIKAGSGTSVDDYTAQFGFYYSTNTYTSNGVTQLIPLAPNSAIGVETNGLKVTVNKNDGVEDAAAVNLYPIVPLAFTNDYALKFDMWVNYNGGENGGSGSTEFAIFGVNMTGLLTNWTFSSLGDGGWFGVTGEGGANRDWRVYVGDAVFPGAPLELQGASGGFLDRDGDSTPEQEVFSEPETAPLKLIFPKPLSETPGVPGKQWVQVEVRQRTNDLGDAILTWLMNGYVIAQYNVQPFLQTNGNIMIGAMDIFPSIASPKQDNFVIFDNVRVIDLQGVATNEVLSIVAADNVAVESGESGTNTIARTGSTAAALTVPFRTSGTAVRGSDYVFRTNGVILTGNSVIIPAGQSSIDIAVDPLNDSVLESQESVYMVLGGNTPGYDIFLQTYAVVDLADDGLDVPVATVSVIKNGYERIASDSAIVSVNLSSTSATDTTIGITVTDSGSGPSYSVTPSATVVTVPAGLTNVLVNMVPVDDALLTPDRTVTVSVVGGSGYAVGSPASTNALIRNDELSVLPVIYSETFENPANSTDWTTKFSSGNGILDFSAIYGYDYSIIGVPPAPNSGGGTTKGYRATVNKDATGSAAAVNLYMTNQSFTGYYALRFDMFISVDGDLAGTTEHSIFGINHSGNITNRHATSGSDGLWYAVETDGSANNLYTSYVGTTNAAPSVTAIQTLPREFINPPWGYSGSPSVRSNSVSLTGTEKLWSEVQVIQEGAVFTLKINNVQIFQRTNASSYSSGRIMLGHMDRFTSIGSPENFTIFDNIRVVRIPTPDISISNIAIVGGNVQIDFTGGPLDGPTIFTLQTSATVNGVYADVSSAITQLAPGSFRAVRPVGGTAQFYRIRR